MPQERGTTYSPRVEWITVARRGAMCRNMSVSKVTGYGPDLGWILFLFATMSRPAARPVPPPIQLVNYPESECHHQSRVPTAEAKNAWNLVWSPLYASMSWVSYTDLILLRIFQVWTLLYIKPNEWSRPCESWSIWASRPWCKWPHVVMVNILDSESEFKCRWDLKDFLGAVISAVSTANVYGLEGRGLGVMVGDRWSTGWG
jgi:hypothetical protein